MERVQFHQEQSLPELKDFIQKGIFTEDEAKHILKKRTAFESALVRRVAKKGDYLRYAAYEMGLETLRRKRVQRLDTGQPSPPSISDYALVRRQFYIFERAVRKFKSDLGLWVQYIQVAKRERAGALVGRLCARALHLHPTSPALFILASSYELDSLSPSSARAMLQRGLRFNPESVELWTEYVKMELGFVESIRRRWDVLGIANERSGQTSTEGNALDEDMGDEAAQKEIMDGAIVKTVIQNAFQAKRIEPVALITSLRKLLQTYPVPIPLRSSLLDFLRSSLLESFPNNSRVLFLYGTWHLDEEIEDGQAFQLVQKVKDAEIVMRKLVLEGPSGKGKEKERSDEQTEMSSVYARWIRECFQRLEERHLRLYLTHSLKSLLPLLPRESLSPSLVAAYLTLLKWTPKLRKQARKYTSQFPTSSEVWLARLGVDNEFEKKEKMMHLWKDARVGVTVEGADVEGMWSVWTWGLENLNLDGEEKTAAFENLLSESITNPSASSLHIRFLSLYLSHAHSPSSSQSRLTNIRRILNKFLTTSEFHSTLFAHEASLDDASREVLEAIYSSWRTIGGGVVQVDAGLRWAEWLLEKEDGKEAWKVVRSLPPLDGEMERRWGEILERYESERQKNQGDENEDDDGMLVAS